MSFGSGNQCLAEIGSTTLDGSWLYLDGSIAVVAVPEPGTWALMGMGLLAVGALARRRAVQAPRG